MNEFLNSCPTNTSSFAARKCDKKGIKHSLVFNNEKNIYLALKYVNISFVSFEPVRNDKINFEKRFLNRFDLIKKIFL